MNKKLSKWWLITAAGIIFLGGIIVVWLWTSFITNDSTSGNGDQIQGGNAKELVDEAKSEEINVDDIETVEDDVEYESISEVIRGFHSYYNNTLGYGGINSISWPEQRQNAEAFIEYANRYADTYEGTLKVDIENAKQYATEIVEGSENTGNLTSIHRILHDLDIAVNGYKNYKKVWGVTETDIE